MPLTSVSTDQPGLGQRDQVCCSGASGAQVSSRSCFDSFVSQVCVGSYVITGPCSGSFPRPGVWSCTVSLGVQVESVTVTSPLHPPRVWQFLSAMLFSSVAIMVSPCVLVLAAGRSGACQLVIPET